jgi:hypothetical protein
MFACNQTVFQPSFVCAIFTCCMYILEIPILENQKNHVKNVLEKLLHKTFISKIVF